ncbi:erythromycin esterase family protein [Streptomyces gardneri]|uniref:erythromycin esterase family protein n=1 Tax=Nocardia sputi TaxID=2943705 RepID=UPI0018958BBC|nr:erythromycin esterase family protein [Nocardia sputi]MBF6168723.1 erythromycin esterase family protein [Streptomyces gardneri]
MSQYIQDFVPATCALLAFGEPTHQEPAFARVRNQLFAQLVGCGFRSITIETDRVAALTVDDFVRNGVGSLEQVIDEGFSHGLGKLDANRQLVTWMREYNATRTEDQQLSFHGFDAPTEMTSAPSPRHYLEFARDYLGLAIDLAGLTGDDERWSRMEAIMDAAASPGATAEAERLRVIADDMLTMLYARAPELIAATSHAEWITAETHLTAGLGLLRYHKQSADRQLDETARVSRMLAVRDALMAQNLLAIRRAESPRGATFVFAQNGHLRRNRCRWSLAGMDLTWFSAGAIADSLLGERYCFVAGSLGHSTAVGLGVPEPDTYEGLLSERIQTWGLTSPATLGPARIRTDPTPEQGYFPLDQATLDGADAVLHIA